MSKSVQQNIDIYNRDAEELSHYYKTKYVPDVLPDFAAGVLKFENRENLRALDIGCGVGQYAYWLAEQGFEVAALDGSEKMIALAQDISPHGRIKYICDLAPELEVLKALGHKYDVILGAAFLFHLDKDQRVHFYEVLSGLANKGAYAYLTLRHGPVPEGRRMFDVLPQEIEQWAKAHNVGYSLLGQRSDAHDRADISWDHIALCF